MNAKNLIKRINYKPLITIAFILILWQSITLIFQFPAYLLPSVIEVFKDIFKYYQVIVRELSVTIYEALVGYGISILVGLPLGVSIVYSKFSKEYIMPILVMTNSVPKSALAPLFLLWAGYGPTSKILISLLMAFFPIVINTAVGLYRIDENKVNLVKALKGNQYQIFTKVRLPNALPSIFAGFKLAITLALIGAVVGEFVGASKGIGVLILSASTEIRTGIVFACIIVLSVVGVALFYGVELAQKLIIPWYKEEEKT